MMDPITKSNSNNDYLDLKEQNLFPILQTPIRKSFSEFIPKSIGLNDSLSSKSHSFIGYKRCNEKEKENLKFRESIHTIKTQESEKSDMNNSCEISYNNSEISDNEQIEIQSKQKNFKIVLDSSKSNIIQKDKKIAEIVLREKLKNDFFGGRSNLSLEEMIKVIKRATVIAGLYKEKSESTNDGTSCTQISAISAIQICKTNEFVVQSNQML